jgi:Kef-type K+ transport system membrane component KefB/voltage-gated potassium channel Kch
LRKSIVGLGGLQVLVTGIIISTIAFIAGLTWQSSLALGMTLSLSSTAIVLQTLNEKGLMKTTGGQSSFAVLLFQDIAVIPMLAFFPLLATFTPETGGEHEAKTLVTGLPAWLHTIVVIGSVAIIVIGGKFLVKPIFRLIAATRLRELFTATALLLVVAIAVLMTQVGLSPALGTFIAGVVLANSEYRHELQSDIDPFKGLLLGLFFIAVGASIDFNLIMEQPYLIIGLVAGLMTIKTIVLFVLGKTFKLSLDQNLLFSFGLSQVGEFAFVLFSFSLQEGVLQKEIVDIMIAVVAISMALTPLVMLINEKILAPRFGTKEEAAGPDADKIEEKNPVIIAGFGHFGSTIGRFLRANGINATYLDNNSDRVDLLRKMGFKVFYGDATREDLLRAAGAEHAKIIIIAIEPAERRLEMIETIKKHFPSLRMLVRATNRYDAYDQMNAGMLHVYRETIDTSLRLGKDALVLLGHRAYKVQRALNTFLKYDEKKLKELAAISDKDEYIITVKGNIEELERLLQADQKDTTIEDDMGWDEETLIADATGSVKKG